MPVVPSFLKRLFLSPGGGLRAVVGPGSKAPVLRVKNHNEGTIDLGKLYDNYTLFIYFYPKAYTNNCKLQAESINKFYDKLRSRGVEVLGVTTDTPCAVRCCRERTHLEFLLVSDIEGELARAFGIPMKFGFVQPCGLLVRNGIVVWRSDKLDPERIGCVLMDALDSLGIVESANV